MSRWSKIKLGKACQISKGQQLNKIDLETVGDYPCINGGIEPSGYTDVWNADANTITISEGGNSCGYVNFLTTRFWSGGHCYTLFDLRDNIDVNFLYQALKGRESFIMGLRVGSGLPNIQQKAIKEFEIEYPENKAEQTIIALILSKVDALIQQTKHLIAKYERIKTGLMQDLLSRGIDEGGSIRNEVTHRFKDSPLGRIPKEWQVCRLSELVRDDCPICYGIVQVGYHDPNGVPTLAIKNLGGDFIKDLHYTSPVIENKYKRSRVIPGDLLVSVKATIGRVAVVPNHFVGNISRDLAKIGFRENISSEFYYYYFQSQRGVKSLMDITVGTTRKELSIVPLKEILVAVVPYDEQLQISKRIATFYETTNQLADKCMKLMKIKTGLMQDLLTGQIRVDVHMNQPTEIV